LFIAPAILFTSIKPLDLIQPETIQRGSQAAMSRCLYLAATPFIATFDIKTLCFDAQSCAFFNYKEYLK